MATSVGGIGLPLFFSSSASATRIAIFNGCLGKSESAFITGSTSALFKVLLTIIRISPSRVTRKARLRWEETETPSSKTQRVISPTTSVEYLLPSAPGVRFNWPRGSLSKDLGARREE